MQKAPKTIEHLKGFALTSPDSNYVFVVPGDIESAYKFIHRMRVELSRLRKKAQTRKVKLVPFKMLIVSVEQIPGKEKSCKITLSKKQRALEDREEIKEIFAALEKKPKEQVDGKESGRIIEPNKTENGDTGGNNATSARPSPKFKLKTKIHDRQTEPKPDKPKTRFAIGQR